RVEELARTRRVPNRSLDERELEPREDLLLERALLPCRRETPLERRGRLGAPAPSDEGAAEDPLRPRVDRLAVALDSGCDDIPRGGVVPLEESELREIGEGDRL